MKHAAEQVRSELKDAERAVASTKRNIQGLGDHPEAKGLPDTLPKYELLAEALRRYLAHVEGTAWHVEARPVEEAPSGEDRFVFIASTAEYGVRVGTTHGGELRAIHHLTEDVGTVVRPLTFNGEFKLPEVGGE